MTKNLGNDFIATIGAREQFVDANKTYDAFTPEFSLLKKLMRIAAYISMLLNLLGCPLLCSFMAVVHLIMKRIHC